MFVGLHIKAMKNKILVKFLPTNYCHGEGSV